MTLSRIPTALAAALLAATLFSVSARAENQNEQRLDITLTPTLFAPTQAVGDASHTVRRHRTDFVVQVEDLDPGFYDVDIDGRFVGQIPVRQVPGGTEGALRLSSRPTACELMLNFDPRGKEIVVRTGLSIMLLGALSTTRNPEAPRENAQFNKCSQLINDAAPGFGPRPRGNLRIKSSRKSAALKFELQRLSNLPHTITANGIPIINFFPGTRGISSIKFSTRPNSKKREHLLDFDPGATAFEVLQGDQVILRFETDNCSIGGGAKPIGQTSADFNALPPALTAYGSASLSDRASSFFFKVEIGGLPPGNYDLLVGGVKKTTIFISTGSDGTSGFASFSTERKNRSDLPLDFDPRGQTIQVKHDQDIALSMTFPRR